MSTGIYDRNMTQVIPQDYFKYSIKRDFRFFLKDVLIGILKSDLLGVTMNVIHAAGRQLQAMKLYFLYSKKMNLIKVIFLQCCWITYRQCLDYIAC